MCHMLHYVHIVYLVQYAEYLMGYEAKYSLTMRFTSFAMIRLATAINRLKEFNKNTTAQQICVIQWNTAVHSCLV